MNATPTNPYIGPRTFQRNEGHLFFGRDREARDLIALVASERLVVFYAQSGAGKSSIVNTRLIANLEAKEYEVLPVGRVSGDAATGIDVDNIYTYNLLRSLEQHDTSPAELAKLSLSQFLEHLNFDDKGFFYDPTPIEALPEGVDSTIARRAVVIDQFEELFTTYPEAWEKRDDFFQQLAQAMQDDPQLWVVLVMREDFIAFLDPYAHLVPGGLRVRYYMQRLGREAGLKAIKSPVEEMRPYAEGVAEKLIDDLCSIKVQKPDGSLDIQPGQYVEPVQLQVVCFGLWDNLAPDGIQITEKDLQDVGDVNQSLGKYYDRRVNEVAKAKNVRERLIREWFEKKLITAGGIRNMVLQERETKPGELDDHVIRALQSDLVRGEKRGGATWYELTHDRLVEPILERNKIWFNENLSPLQRQAALWWDQDQNESWLLRDHALMEVEQWAKDHNDELTDIEREFLEACQKVQTQIEERQATERNRLEMAQKFADEQTRSAQIARRSAQTARRFSVIALGLFVVASFTGFIAINTGRDAVNAKSTSQALAETAVAGSTTVANSLSTAQVANNSAESAKGIIEADNLAGQAQIALSQSDSIRLGQLLAVKAYEKMKSANSGKISPSVYQALFDSAGKGDDLVLSTKPFSSAAFSSSGQLLALDNVVWNLVDTSASKLDLGWDEVRQGVFLSDEEIVLLTANTEYYSSAQNPYNVNIVDLLNQKKSQINLILPDNAYFIDINLSENGRWATMSYGASSGGGALLWDLQTPANEPKQELKAQGPEIQSVAISRSNDELAMTDGSNIFFYNKDAKENYVLKISRQLTFPFSNGSFSGKSARGIQYSPDSKWLVVLTESNVQIYDTNNDPTPILFNAITIDKEKEKLLGLSFSDDSKTLIYVTSNYFYCRDKSSKTCQPNASAFGFTLANNASKPYLIYKSTAADITAMNISPDKLAIGDTAGYVRAWDINQIPGQPFLVTSAHAGEINDILIAPNSPTVISASQEDNTTRLWKLTESNTNAVVVTRLSNTVSGVVRSEDGNELVVGGINAENAVGTNVHIYTNLQTPNSLNDSPFNSNNGGNSNLSAIAISQDWVAAARRDNSFSYLGNGSFLLDFWKRNSEATSTTLQLPSEISSLAFYPDGGYLVTAVNSGSGGTAEIWINGTAKNSYLSNIIEKYAIPADAALSDIPILQADYKIPTDLANIQRLLFTKDGSFLIGASIDGVRVWNMQKNAEATSLTNSIYPISISLDQKWLITAGLDNTLQLFDLQNITADPSIILPANKAAIAQFSFSQNGETLAVADKTGKILLYNLPLTSNSTFDTLRGPTSEINSLEFSPVQSKTGNWLVASSGNTVYLWNLANPNEKPITLQGYKGDVIYAGFTNDGEWIATAAKDQTLKFWSMDLEKVSTTVCNYAGRNLTLEEWKRYFKDEYRKICEQNP